MARRIFNQLHLPNVGDGISCNDAGPCDALYIQQEWLAEVRTRARYHPPATDMEAPQPAVVKNAQPQAVEMSE